MTQTIATFARQPNRGLILPTDSVMVPRYKLVADPENRHRLHVLEPVTTAPATVPLGWKTLLRFHHRHIGFDRIGNEAILVGSMVHPIKFFHTWYTIRAPRELRA